MSRSPAWSYGQAGHLDLLRAVAPVVRPYGVLGQAELPAEDLRRELLGESIPVLAAVVHVSAAAGQLEVHHFMHQLVIHYPRTGVQHHRRSRLAGGPEPQGIDRDARGAPQGRGIGGARQRIRSAITIGICSGRRGKYFPPAPGVGVVDVAPASPHSAAAASR